VVRRRDSAARFGFRRNFVEIYHMAGKKQARAREFPKENDPPGLFFAHVTLKTRQSEKNIIFRLDIAENPCYSTLKLL
jgi:hypothetical protein